MMENKYLTVKELPESERPYERCEKYGAKALSDAELLAVILRCGTKNERAIDLAYRILSLTGKEKSLAKLPRLGRSDLIKIHGVGHVKASQILCACELSERIAMSQREEGLKLFSPKAVADYYSPKLRHLEKEQSMILFADSKSRIIGDQLLALGTVNASLMSAREVYLAALKQNAVYIILLHNHPSGDPTPSNEDHLVTNRIKEAGELLGILLLDHIIIGDNRYISFKEMGFMQQGRRT